MTLYPNLAGLPDSINQISEISVIQIVLWSLNHLSTCNFPLFPGALCSRLQLCAEALIGAPKGWDSNSYLTSLVRLSKVP